VISDNIGIFPINDNKWMEMARVERIKAAGKRYTLKIKELFTIDSLGNIDILGAAKLPRQVAKIVGILVWGKIVALESFATISKEIDALRGAKKFVLTKADWTKPLEEPHLRKIRQILPQENIGAHRAALSMNTWRKGRQGPPAEETIFLASDATETSIAGVMLSSAGAAVSHFKEHGVKFTHIFAKEVIAIYSKVIWAQRAKLARGNIGPAGFRIAVNNKAAAAAAMRCDSSFSQVNDLLLRLFSTRMRSPLPALTSIRN